MSVNQLVPNLNMDDVLSHVKSKDAAFSTIWRELDAMWSGESTFPLLESCFVKIPWLQTQTSLQEVFPESAKRLKLDVHPPESVPEINLDLSDL